LTFSPRIAIAPPPPLTITRASSFGFLALGTGSPCRVSGCPPQPLKPDTTAPFSFPVRSLCLARLALGNYHPASILNPPFSPPPPFPSFFKFCGVGVFLCGFVCFFVFDRLCPLIAPLSHPCFFLMRSLPPNPFFPLAPPPANFFFSLSDSNTTQSPLEPFYSPFPGVHPCGAVFHPAVPCYLLPEAISPTPSTNLSQAPLGKLLCGRRLCPHFLGFPLKGS